MDKQRTEIEERLDRLEKALGVINNIFFIMRCECKDNVKKPHI